MKSVQLNGLLGTVDRYRSEGEGAGRWEVKVPDGSIKAIKPENLMVFDGCLKLIDVDGCVDIGSRLSLSDPSLSFSPVYCAPEWASFLLGNEEAGLSATPGLDAWSVGCTICELVTLDAILKPAYVKLVRRDRHQGPGLYLDWLKGLEQAPVPKAVKQFDEELAQLMSGCLLVCDRTLRSSCAESLDTPYLARDKLQKTKSSPLKVEAHDTTPDEGVVQDLM